jgi:hypothetical protein
MPPGAASGFPFARRELREFLKSYSLEGSTEDKDFTMLGRGG